MLLQGIEHHQNMAALLKPSQSRECGQARCVSEMEVQAAGSKHRSTKGTLLEQKSDRTRPFGRAGRGHPLQDAAGFPRGSNPLAPKTGFLDVKLAAKLEEDLVVNNCLSAQTCQFFALGCQQCPRQSPQRLIFVE